MSANCCLGDKFRYSAGSNPAGSSCQLLARRVPGGYPVNRPSLDGDRLRTSCSSPSFHSSLFTAQLGLLRNVAAKFQNLSFGPGLFTVTVLWDKAPVPMSLLSGNMVAVHDGVYKCKERLMSMEATPGESAEW
ncbi:MAG: hypothetical protein PHF24_06125 [Syntrophomonas sp.]|nr:hypothetical protein [Syntrophomonas sp.]